MFLTPDAMLPHQVAEDETGIENHTSAVRLGATEVANRDHITLVKPEATNTVYGGSPCLIMPEVASLAASSTQRPMMHSFGTMEPTIMGTFRRESEWSNTTEVTKMG